tara:strand:+ start:211 stop:2010 length:1800 start_codon:yes stop_codon:yes gene_type:complete
MSEKEQVLENQQSVNNDEYLVSDGIPHADSRSRTDYETKNITKIVILEMILNSAARLKNSKKGHASHTFLKTKEGSFYFLPSDNMDGFPTDPTEIVDALTPTPTDETERMKKLYEKLGLSVYTSALSQNGYILSDFDDTEYYIITKKSGDELMSWIRVDYKSGRIYPKSPELLHSSNVISRLKNMGITDGYELPEDSGTLFVYPIDEEMFYKHSTGNIYSHFYNENIKNDLTNDLDEILWPAITEKKNFNYDLKYLDLDNNETKSYDFSPDTFGVLFHNNKVFTKSTGSYIDDDRNTPTVREFDNLNGKTTLCLLGFRLTHGLADEWGLDIPEGFRIVYSRYGEMPIYNAWEPDSGISWVSTFLRSSEKGGSTELNYVLASQCRKPNLLMDDEDRVILDPNSKQVFLDEKATKAVITRYKKNVRNLKLFKETFPKKSTQETDSKIWWIGEIRDGKTRAGDGMRERLFGDSKFDVGRKGSGAKDGLLEREGSLEDGLLEPDYYWKKDETSGIYNGLGEGKFFGKTPPNSAKIKETIGQILYYVTTAHRLWGDDFELCFFTTDHLDSFDPHISVLRQNLEKMGIKFVAFDLTYEGYDPDRK